MAGLATSQIPPTDAQPAKSRAPLPANPFAANSGSGLKFRLDQQNARAFDAILNDRQPPPARPPDRGPAETGFKRPPGIDRSPAPDRSSAAADPAPRASNRTERSQPPGATAPDRPDRLDRPGQRAAATAEDKGSPKTKDTAPNSKAGETEQTDAVTDITDGEDTVAANQFEAALTETPPDAQESEQNEAAGEISAAAGEQSDGDPDETAAAPAATADGTTGTTTGSEGAEIPVLPGEVEDLLQKGDAETDTDAGDEVQTKAEAQTASALPLAAKGLPSDAAARQAAAVNETAAGAPKKGDGPMAPQLDGAATPDAEGGEDQAPANKSRNPDVNTAANSAKADAAPQKSASASFAAELGQAPRAPAPASSAPSGTALAPQIDASAAVFRTTAPSTPGAPPNLPVRAIALHIANRAAGGATTFQIRLDPPEMGRIDVKLEIARDGRVSAQLTVDRPETLEALQRDQRGLERTLQNAGLDTGDDGLSFNLRQEPQAGADRGDGDAGSGNTGDRNPAGLSEDAALEAKPQFIGLTAIDIRV